MKRRNLVNEVRKYGLPAQAVIRENLETVSQQLERTVDRILELEKTVRWYADRDQYRKLGAVQPAVLFDRGARARMALDREDT